MCGKSHLPDQGHHPALPGEQREQVTPSKLRNPPRCPQTVPLPPASLCPQHPCQGGQCPPSCRAGTWERSWGTDRFRFNPGCEKKCFLRSFLSVGLKPPLGHPPPPQPATATPGWPMFFRGGVTRDVGGSGGAVGWPGKRRADSLQGGLGVGGMKPNAPRFPFLLSNSPSRLPWADVSFVPAREEGTPPTPPL